MDMALNTDPSKPELVAGVGALLAVVGAFLPWITTGVEAGPVDVSTAVTGVETVGVVTLVLALAVLALLLFVTDDRLPAVTAVVGLVVGLVALWKYVDLGGAAGPGLGLYLTVLAGLVMFVGGGWGHTAQGEARTL